MPLVHNDIMWYKLHNILTVLADGLSVDWVSQKLYWADAELKVISVYDLIRGYRKTLISTGDTTIPRAIVADPLKRYVGMFVCGCKFGGSLRNFYYRCDLDMHGRGHMFGRNKYYTHDLDMMSLPLLICKCCNDILA